MYKSADADPSHGQIRSKWRIISFPNTERFYILRKRWEPYIIIILLTQLSAFADGLPLIFMPVFACSLLVIFIL